MPRHTSDPRASDWLGAIAEPNRLAILRLLTGGNRSVAEVTKALQCESGNASHHLRRMKAVGLLESEKDGASVSYGLIGATVTAAHLTLTHGSGIVVTIPLR